MLKLTIFVLALASTFVAGCGPAAPEYSAPVIVPSPTGNAALGPRFTRGPAGRIAMSWMERAESGATLRYSVLQDDGWGPATDVVTDPRMFVNWTDLPSVLRVRDDHWIAHWLSYSAEKTYSYDVVVAQSSDGGRSWSDPAPAHTDGTPTEHGFVSMHRNAHGVALLWLDGRDTGNEPTGNPLDTSMTLRAAILTPDGRRLDEHVIDDSVCDCCKTDVAISSQGPLAVYRDRTADEVRDIYLARHVDGQWQAGERIHPDNWKIPGCPANGPAIVADGDLVGITWFSAADDNPVVRAIISTDGGTTFGAPVEIASGRIAGYLGAAILDDASLAVSWVALGDASGNPIRVRRVDATGQLGEVRTVGNSNLLRIVPQLARYGDDLVFAWTDKAGDSTQVVTARLAIGPGR